MDKNLKEEIKEVELSLARVILTQLEKGALTYEQSREIAGFILSGIDEVKTAENLLSFLQVLYNKWNIFESTYGLYKLRINDFLTREQRLENINRQLASITQN